ncbi:patatin-like phospholipase family protein [Aequorivita sinensis]|uniref:patatin-like phospholipase family protein n=1 Tax=Aequorivita sinensis TaxID=1382458 RepID=UPI002300078E|nr:patatin-like phospholipase family protein [Aequorivita sinensis]
MENEKTFKLCLTMAGAVSAGAYTAGVLDYLLETLELWEKAKVINRSRGINHPDYDHSIPMHQVEIDVMSGSSAGGISGSLTLLALADKNYKSINKDNPNGIDNIFYRSWVEMADTKESSTIDKLLGDNDLKEFGEVRSLLNTKAIDDIADEAIRIREQREIPKYASDSLDVILTTTNLRGINFLVNFDGSRDSSKGTVITNHGGFFRYKLKNDKYKSGIPVSEDELYYVLDISKKKHLQYLKEATLSTAAFPIGLRSREVAISSEYIKRYPKYLFNQSKGIEPLLPEGDIYTFNSVDGGVINNEPYGIALKVLKEKNPKSLETCRYGVIMIDPFPNKDKDVSKSGKSISSIAKGLLRSLRNQVMFNQEGILDALDLSDRTKFLIEPVRKIKKNGEWVRSKSDLASAPIGGFAGFLSRDFRAHDFQLGRKNCQAFLRYYFAIPSEEIETRLSIKPSAEIKERFEFSVPPMDVNGDKLFPIIPDMRVLRSFNNKFDAETYGEDADIQDLPFPKMSFSEFENRYKSKIKKRIGLIVKYLLKNRFLSFLANFFYAKNAGYKFVKETIEKELAENDLLK